MSGIVPDKLNDKMQLIFSVDDVDFIPKATKLLYDTEENELEVHWGYKCMILSESLLVIRGDTFDVSTSEGMLFLAGFKHIC